MNFRAFSLILIPQMPGKSSYLQSFAVKDSHLGPLGSVGMACFVT